jgi:hypothetical protein
MYRETAGCASLNHANRHIYTWLNIYLCELFFAEANIYQDCIIRVDRSVMLLLLQGALYITNNSTRTLIICLNLSIFIRRSSCIFGEVLGGFYVDGSINGGAKV